ncbi:TetR family transcriptional regulator [Nocardia jinanensis]|uniref:TetR family transcriptional regulator n=1 Tax=Nocardia jinanensis TaxID=382504 RepID=UPI001E33A362|nr:TetR family transcriptional regulator [Nocardia jinanensis]
MNGSGEVDAAARILDSVVEIIESDGYDAVQLRTVAKRARVSLTTIYALHSSRDELILAAVEAWMAAHSYVELTQHPQEELADGLMRLIRCVFQPWEQSPQMARAFFRARATPGGHRLDRQGFEAVLPAAGHLLAGLDRDYVTDIALVMINLCYAMVGRLVDGTADVPTILSSLERVMHRLTSDNTRLATQRPAAGAQSGTPTLDFSLFSLFGPGIGEPSDPGANKDGRAAPGTDRTTP